jgi:xylulokinase
VLADLSGRAVLVPRSDQQVATGACVQAAAVATGEEPADIADRWRVGEGEEVEPGPGASASAEVRAAYSSLRDADHP